ncbi:MAG: hypothetical protein KY469_06310 [Actinobacteria bacterium]|nr:hypothetical protein [Actinomycetota bacterium]
MPTRQFTDAQLRAVLRQIARTYLEVERGLRPPDHLAAFLIDAEYQRHRKRPQELVASAGPVMREDIGRIHLERRTAGSITATIVARHYEKRRGALMVGLREGSGGWRVSQLTWLERLPVVSSRGEVQPPEPDDFDRRLQDVERELRLVTAAHKAATRWVEELQADATVDKRPGALLRAREQTARWSDRVDELEREIGIMKATEQLRRTLDEGGAESAPAPLTDDPVLGTLGPRPDHERWAKIWDETVDELNRYRERWNIAATDDPLGDVPEDSEQMRQRELLTQLLRAVVPWLEHGRRSTREAPSVHMTVEHAPAPGFGLEA